jgi:hypothetical protein
MDKKKTKKKSPRKACGKVDEECVALIRGYFKRKGFAPREQVANGAHVFADVFETIESIVTIVRMFVAVERKEVSAVCEIPLQVPKSRVPEVLTFINHMNSEDLECGVLVLDPEDNTVSIRNECQVSVIKSDVEKAMEDFFAPMIAQSGVCADNILEIITGGSLEGQQDENEAEASAKVTGTTAKGAEAGKRAPKGTKAPTAITPDYSLDGLDIRSEVPLEQIVAAVAMFSKTRRSSEVTPRLSILLSGPSGCGKSEFVKYLGECAGKEVVVVTASDVLRALVGETEQRIADVFREAAEKNAILFLDEVDSLLYDRKSAHYGWERVQTNELLIQMERFTGVLVCATNLVEQLDAAVMRRFTFKVQMAALDDDGKVKFFSRYFKSELSADERRRLLSIPNLTPGDFRTVRERLFFLAGKNGADNARRLAALEVESAAKKDSRAHIGFTL